MKSFKFSLEVLLKERKRQEEAKLRDWVSANKILQDAIATRISLENKLLETVQLATELTTVENNISSQYFVVDRFIDGTKKRIEWKKTEITKITKWVAQRYAEYLKARQKREAIDKLKSKRFEEFKKAQRKIELKQLDDIYTNMRRETEDGAL